MDPIFFLFLFCCFLAGMGGNFWQRDTWYRELNKPTFAPPRWFSRVVWLVLYFVMSAAVTLLVEHPHALGVWMAQLLVHSWFFPILLGKKDIKLAFQLSFLSWFMVGVTTFVFLPLSVTASVAMSVVWLWTTFMTLQSFFLWQRNR